MAYIVEEPGSSRWTVTRRISYPAQDKAARHLKYTEAAREYWRAFRRDGGPERACEILRDRLDSDERKDDDFLHILGKMKPCSPA